jgi:AAA domain-containing protein
MVKIAREAQSYFQNQFGLDLVSIGIDTMAAAAGWDNENDAAQAQIVMNHLADLSKATDAAVLAVDHFGKDVSAGTRGSVVKEASADTILAALGERDADTNTVTDTRLVIRKQRSGPQGGEFPFEARLVKMGEDRDGEPLTDILSCPRCARSCRERMQQKGILYSITSSARCWRNQGRSRPSALAVLRLITRSNLVGCTIGNSAGFAPLRIFPA